MEAAQTFEHIVSSAKKNPTQKCPPVIIPLLKTLKMTTTGNKTSHADVSPWADFIAVTGGWKVVGGYEWDLTSFCSFYWNLRTHWHGFSLLQKYSADRLKAGLNRRTYRLHSLYAGECVAWRGYPGQARKSAVKSAIIITSKCCANLSLWKPHPSLKPFLRSDLVVL